MDRYEMSRAFELAKFEMQIMKVSDLYQLQEMCIRLYSQTLAQRRVYESMLKNTRGLPPGK
jgi:hypothetical protein